MSSRVHFVRRKVSDRDGGVAHVVCGPYVAPGYQQRVDVCAGVERPGFHAEHLFLSRGEARALAAAIRAALDGGKDDEAEAEEEGGMLCAPITERVEPGARWQGLVMHERIYASSNSASCVCACETEDTGEPVALKCAFPPDGKEAARLRSEYRALTSLPPHPNVVGALGWHADARGVGFSLERCDKTLLEYVNEHGVARPFREGEICAIFAQLAAALAHCYENGVAHRDVKLDNVLLRLPGGPGRAPLCKLADFEYARAYAPGPRRWPPCGTLWYMAPEVLHGRPHDAELADAWSAGVILYAMFESRLPFVAPDRTREEEFMRRAVSAGVYLRPSHASPQALDLISALLRGNPEARPRFRDVLLHPWVANARLPVPLPPQQQHHKARSSSSGEEAGSSSPLTPPEADITMGGGGAEEALPPTYVPPVLREPVPRRACELPPPPPGLSAFERAVAWWMNGRRGANGAV